MTSWGFFKPNNRLIIGLIVAATALTGATGLYVISQVGQMPKSIASEPETNRSITALGRLQPETEVIKIAPPLALSGDRIAELRVKEGDSVKFRQIIAVLDSYKRLQDEVKQAEEQVRVAESKLAQVKSGAKTGEIQAQQASVERLKSEIAGEIEVRQAEIKRWQAEVRTARSEYDRFQQLYANNAIAASTLDSKRLSLDSTQAQLNQVQATQSRSVESLQAQLQEARANLNRIVEVRPVDVQTAQAETNQAIASLKRAQTNLEQAYVRSPLNGQVLKINTRVGEIISNSLGIVDLGETDRMIVVAEVYQTDISKIKAGQLATIKSQGFAGELQGEVFYVGLQVSRQNVFGNQPGENLDRRVIEVKIRLTPAASQQVKSLTNLQVQVAINS